MPANHIVMFIPVTIDKRKENHSFVAVDMLNVFVASTGDTGFRIAFQQRLNLIESLLGSHLILAPDGKNLFHSIKNLTCAKPGCRLRFDSCVGFQIL